MPTTPAYRKGWDRIFGKKEEEKKEVKKPCWYLMTACYICGEILSRKRAYGPKPKERHKRMINGPRCRGCSAAMYKRSQRYA